MFEKMKKLGSGLVEGTKKLVNKSLMVVGMAAGAAVSTVATAPSAHAVDVTAAVTSLGEVSTAIATVGGAIIGLAVLAMGYRWVKATFF